MTASSSFRFSDKFQGIFRRFVAPCFRKSRNLKPANLRRSVGTEDFAPKDFWLTNERRRRHTQLEDGAAFRRNKGKQYCSAPIHRKDLVTNATYRNASGESSIWERLLYITAGYLWFCILVSTLLRILANSQDILRARLDLRLGSKQEFCIETNNRIVVPLGG